MCSGFDGESQIIEQGSGGSARICELYVLECDVAFQSVRRYNLLAKQRRVVVFVQQLKDPCASPNSFHYIIIST